MNENTNFKEFEIIEGYEFCRHCGWENKDHEELPQEGAPISGFHHICPKCNKDWEFEKIITKKIKMVQMTKEHFEDIRDHKCDKSCPYFTTWLDNKGIREISCTKQHGM